MNYNETVKALAALLATSGFNVVESRKHFNKYESDLVSIHISFDERENSLSLFVGKKGGHLFELGEKVYEDVFHEDIEHFKGLSLTDNLIYFLNGKGNAILKGDIGKLDELEVYHLKAARAYTASLINQQNILLANRAWSENNYADFIRYTDIIDKKILTKSYELKRKIALAKLTNDKEG